MGDELEKFRENWKGEIEFRKAVENLNLDDEPSQNVEGEKEDEPKVNMEAIQLFQDGINHEKQGNMSKAVSCYRQAIKLDPHIEKVMSKIEKYSKKSNKNEGDMIYQVFLNQLIDRIQERKTSFEAERGGVVQFEKLPAELIELIIEKCIGKQNDLLTLERISLTCAAFFVHSTNDNLWRMIHNRANQGDTTTTCNSDSWKSHFLSTPQVYFHGFYSCKISYIRHGEPSFQDSNYSSWHTVTYYRVLRLFPSGRAIYGITSENPRNVSELTDKSGIKTNDAIMRGTFKVECGLLKVDVSRPCPKPKKTVGKFRDRLVKVVEHGVVKQDYTIRFAVKFDGKCRCGLEWISNHLETTFLNNEVSKTDIEVSNIQDFPPMRFHATET
ncbi:unnamed protein product [Caenorhabditis angaria]|uniref:F-box protein Hrt3/FBXO9 C-terminal domain-containing protein n=1 Tax=Caenorhabditis angaria TaxID=860376 RepID=A0A9P1IYD0_9PELO|nr:unnamed protein product [Caenorhabditis angaria]